MWYMRKCADPWEMTTEVFKEKCDNTCRENSKGSPLSPTPTKSACVWVSVCVCIDRQM